MRRRAGAGLGFLGVRLDEGSKEAAQPDAEVGAAGAAVRSFVVAAREDVQIVRELEAAGQSPGQHVP